MRVADVLNDTQEQHDADFEKLYLFLKQESAKALEKLHESPIVKKRLDAMSRDPIIGSHIKTPTDAIAERDLLAGYLQVRPEQFLKPNTSASAPAKELAEAFFEMAGLAHKIRDGQVFIWFHNVREVATQLPLPDHVFGPEGWPHRLMWWAFETPIPVDNDKSLRSIFLEQRTNGIDMLSFQEHHFETQNPRPRIVLSQLEYGTKILSTDPDNKNLVPLLRMIAFLNSQYVVAPHQRLDRASRRQLSRAGTPKSAEETVRVVDLRTIQHEKGRQPNHGEPVDWGSRWWVRGHIRAQWCPSSQSHKLIWIAAHLKGPEDKPIAEKVYRVVQ